jgi:hypothetical protein
MAEKSQDDKPTNLERELEKSRPSIVKTLLKRFYRDFGANAVRNSQKSRQWFREQATKMGKLRTARIMTQRDWITSTPKIGKLYLFQYDAKWKDELPYWDMMPLVFFFNSYTKNGTQYLVGMNLHYLQPALRMVLFAQLLSLRNEKRYRKNTRLRLTWEILQSMSSSRLVGPCVKQYITKNIRSKFIEVPPSDWEVIIPLGLERFQKASSAKVWGDSVKRSRKS